MTTYALAPDPLPDGCTGGITAGKLYKVYDDDNWGFRMRRDDGAVLLCNWQGCAHLMKGDWCRLIEWPIEDPHAEAMRSEVRL